MKTKVYNCAKKSFEKEVDLVDDIFSSPINEDLIAQVYHVYRSNQRKSPAHAKGRGDVSGGGRKPWKQKGTGRARHGSIRSPLWVGGGVTFSPTGVNWKRRVNKKMVKLAIKQVLSGRVADESLVFVEMKDVSNEDARNCANNLLKSASAVFISDDSKLRLALRNLDGVSVVSSKDFNILDLINAGVIVIDEGCVNNIVKRLS